METPPRTLRNNRSPPPAPTLAELLNNNSRQNALNSVPRMRSLNNTQVSSPMSLATPPMTPVSNIRVSNNNSSPSTDPKNNRQKSTSVLNNVKRELTFGGKRKRSKTSKTRKGRKGRKSQRTRKTRRSR